MDRDKVIRMAKEAGFPDWWINPSEPERKNGESVAMLERFAALVAAFERERCARLIEEASCTGRIVSCLGASKAIRALP